MRREDVAVVAVCASACGGLAIGAVSGASARAGAAGALLGAGAAAVGVLVRRRRGWLVMCAGIGLCLSGLGMARGATAAHQGVGTIVGGAVHVKASVRDAPVVRRAETVLVVEPDVLTSPRDLPGSIGVALPGRVDIGPGDHVELEATGLRAVASRGGPTASSAVDRSGADAVAVSPRVTLIAAAGPSPGRAVAAVRARIPAAVDATVAEPHATLLTAIAFGIHGSIPTALRQPLQDAGLIHLVATSGLKVAIVAGIVARLLALAAAGPRTRLWTTIAALVGYIAIAGGGVAAVRSAVMALVGLALRGSGRRVAPIPLLALVATAMLGVDPRLCADVGFQLSFLGTLGIVVGAAPLARRIPGPRLLVEPLAVTLAAQLVTAPVSAVSFGSISLVGPLANALAVPLVPALIVTAWAGVVLGALTPSLGAPLLLLAQLLTEVIERTASVCAALPGAAIHLDTWPHAYTWAELTAVAAGGAGLLAVRLVVGIDGHGSASLVWRRGRRWRWPTGGRAGRRDRDADGRVAPLAWQRWTARQRNWAIGLVTVGGALTFGGTALGLAATQAVGGLHLTVLDVGASSAVVVHTPSGATALVGGGSDGPRLVSALGAELPPTDQSIGMLVLSGGERTAIGGLAALAGHVGVRDVVVPGGQLGTAGRQAVLALRDTGARVTAVPIGGAWSWGGAAWRFVDIGAPRDVDAVVGPLAALEVRTAEGSALVLGDAAVPAQEELAGTPGIDGGVAALVAPPGALLAPALLSWARPRLVVIPCATRPKVSLDGVPTGAVHHTCVEGAVRVDVGLAASRSR